MHHVEFRRPVDAMIDKVRFRLDTFPKLAYQPLPQIGKPEALRDAGVYSRWKAISAVSETLNPATALDIGSQVGFFTLSFAQAGTPTVAVEMEPRYYRTLIHAAKMLELNNVGILIMELTPTTAPMLPQSDAVIFLSVWHHLVRYQGEDLARELLQNIWARTNKVLFFETGENEMPARYGLPDMGSDAKEWVTKMLLEECQGGTIQFLGRHSAFDPEDQPCERNLFAVLREH